MLLVVLPWSVRRRLLILFCGYELHPESHIGLAWVFPCKLVMARGARIGHLTVAKGLARIVLGESASIGRLNWITGHAAGDTRHFTHLPGRRPELLLAEHSAITHRHLIDCTERITLGRFATVAGFRSQLLTHSIDLVRCRQDARPISIGEYCFVGTACTLLGGAALPAYSVLGANALLNKAYEESCQLYAGVPAVPVSKLDPGLGYFIRSEGSVA